MAAQAFAYALEYITQFNATTVGAFAVPAAAGGVSDAVLDSMVPLLAPAAPAAPGGAAGPAGNARLRDAVQAIFTAQTTVSKQGKTVKRIPKSDEIIARAAAVVQNGPLVGQGRFEETFRGDAYKSVPQSTFDTMKSLFGMNAEKASAWDSRVDDIYEKLSNAPGAAGDADAIPAENRLVQPWRNTANAFSTYSATLQEGVRRARTPPTQNAQGVLRALVVAERPRGFAGGNAQRGGAHAPLYPSMVMNGGAHPFAVLNGGDVDPTAVLVAKITQLAAQYKALTGQDLPMLGEINNFKTAVNDNLKNVNERLQTLANANAAIAQYPLALGTNVPGTADELKAYADRALELNKAATKASRKLDRLVEIRDLIQDLVNKQGPARLNGFPYNN
jgi:hypothetical protein